MVSSADKSSSSSDPNSVASSKMIGSDEESSSAPSKIVMMKHLKCVTLDGDNYFSWKAQFSALLRGYRLMHYVEGKVVITEGPFAEQQDQLILSWLLTSISPSLLS